MAVYGFNSPNVQGVSTPLSGLSHSPLSARQQSPVTSYVVPGGSPVKVVSSPNVSKSVGSGFSQTSGVLPQNSQETREISTVYLPPIRYRYDNVTGTLVQVSDQSQNANFPSGSNVQSPSGPFPPNFSPPLSSFSPTFNSNLSHFLNSNPLNQTNQFNFQNQLNQMNGQKGMNSFLNQPMGGPNRVPTPRNEAFKFPNFSPPNFNKPVQTQFSQPSGPQFNSFQPSGSQFDPGLFNNSQFSGAQFKPPFQNSPQFNQPAGPQFNQPPSGLFGNYNHSVPTFGNVQNPLNTRTPGGGNFHRYGNHLYMDTPRARYEAAVKDYYDRMNNYNSYPTFGGYNPNPGGFNPNLNGFNPNFNSQGYNGFTPNNFNGTENSPIGFSKAFSKFEDVATKLFTNSDSLVSDIKNAAFKIFNANSPDYMRAVVFKLDRLENVPVNPNSVSKLTFSVVAYFDVDTENYNIHKSEQQWALPTETQGLVNCDLKGESIKIPWKGEEFVFLKILEHVGYNRFVLGRLQLKLDTLVTGHPLKVTIIGDDGKNKGSAILEFGIGAVSLEEFNQMNMQSNNTNGDYTPMHNMTRRDHGRANGNFMDKNEEWKQTKLRNKYPKKVSLYK
ncbi:hypothetical protein TpMuguga_01g00239 [Theileria parva strain Muguga]|uniref:Uncharacterized protein n=1 Tax=Theileria parva TaxID=5875 RepID=Q4N975_THEPA|nr:uncharacterized protein TpMuguga_01g00239 [Theileria parva strain Muguga]EAN33483.1 hypothetical protein TpMuguga_01g00239 [Theileria parva strain Muguga]|eukprot:XP_765766.1 hypothetical protein [Theileria parva strain Muguga]